MTFVAQLAEHWARFVESQVQLSTLGPTVAFFTNGYGWAWKHMILTFKSYFPFYGFDFIWWIPNIPWCHSVNLSVSTCLLSVFIPLCAFVLNHLPHLFSSFSGHYNINESLIHRSVKGPSAPFKSTTERKMACTPDLTPGPATYNPFQPRKARQRGFKFK